VPDRCAREVGDDVGAVDDLLVDVSGVGVPLRLVGRDGLLADQADDVVALTREVLAHALTEEAGRAATAMRMRTLDGSAGGGVVWQWK
jgi:hypothetical protein